ncbi:MAG: hypothetical protein K2Q09_05870 [Phycisphaerales bacterium]|nr:hypothetical protein [Phycisphaerales bacterium]
MIDRAIPRRSDQIKHEESGPRPGAVRQPARGQCVPWLKQNRRVDTRCDKLATGFQASVHPAIIKRCLRIPPPDDPSDSARRVRYFRASSSCQRL